MEEHVLLTSQIRTTQYSERDMEPDLLKCVQTYAGKPTAQNSAFRQCRLIYWADRAKTLRNDNSFGEYYDEHHPARAIAERINVPVVEEILHAMGAATNGVKNEFVHRLGFGFPVVDDLREEGVFDVRPLSRSAKKEFIETKAALIHKQHPLLRSLRRQCIRDGNWKEIADQLQIEVEKGWLQGPYTVHDLPVDHFIPIRRFIVVQGEKHRGCDNGRATNKVTRVHTPISLLGIDNAIATAASMIEHGVEHLSQAVLDQSDAYKSLIADSTQQRYAVVVALNATTQELECYLSNVLCFGTESAVLDYNCLSRFVTAAARRIMGIPAAGYFDDFHMLARADDIEGMAEDFQFFFSNIIGLIFKDAKKRTGQVLPYLGVLVDVSSSVFSLSITEERASKLRGAIDAILDEDSLSSSQAAKLVGQLGFVQQSMSGSIGRAFVHPIRTRQYSKVNVAKLGARLRDALRWWKEALCHSRFHRQIDASLLSTPRTPIIIYTDASMGQLGVCFCYKSHRYYASTHSAVNVANRDRFPVGNKDEENIQLYETETVISAQHFLNAHHELLFPEEILDDLFSNIPQYYFIDNVCTQATLVKGHSENRLFNDMTKSFWFEAVTAKTADVWLERVESAHNIADLPSRQLGRIRELERMGFAYIPGFTSSLPHMHEV
ncbi:hypothetical protein DIPPA_26631 [Diplonema papillatum]|nr:hypothetical protein DIPPA_20929 [Diplonema papillatum]KAJ9438227.1 hypothetical protein DIPPA_04681 [Diplonema papillatum]KAJ9466127.1 hypothetical protein DIPPA_26631 [Diplonema papillatum]